MEQKIIKYLKSKEEWEARLDADPIICEQCKTCWWNEIKVIRVFMKFHDCEVIKKRLQHAKDIMVNIEAKEKE